MKQSTRQYAPWAVDDEDEVQIMTPAQSKAAAKGAMELLRKRKAGQTPLPTQEENVR